MKRYWKHIRLILGILLVAGLYSFSNIKRNARMVESKADITFLNEEALYITSNSVDKLLIQKADTASGVAVENIDLNRLEQVLNADKMIRQAEVYLTVDGKLGAKVEQRTPIARVAGALSYYVDIDGLPMPLSPVYAARVPLITGQVDKDNLQEVFPLADYIYRDEFLKKQVIGVHKKGDTYELRFRAQEFILTFDGLESLERKFNNFKAFYQKGRKDKSLALYKVVNLGFDNQVVCTKK